MIRKVKLIAGGVLILGIAAFSTFHLLAAEKAPPIALQIIDGRTLQLEALRGQPVLLTFWATTCSICIREMPHLVELYRDLHPRGLELIGIAMAYDPPSYVLQMVERRQLPYPIALDINGSAARAFGDVALTPTTILISPNGRIVKRTLGALDSQALRRLIEAML